MIIRRNEYTVKCLCAKRLVMALLTPPKLTFGCRYALTPHQCVYMIQHIYTVKVIPTSLFVLFFVPNWQNVGYLLIFFLRMHL